MSMSKNWSILNVRLAHAVPLAIATASIGFAAPAFAAGTAAGSTISNTATATYNDTGGNSNTVNSNQVDLRVDELLDVTVASADAGDITTTPGSTNQILSFIVTNNGNGSEAFTLTPNSTLGGDQFDPTTTSVVIDTNNNGVYDAGIDTVYTAGVNDPILAPDASTRVFVLTTTPVGVANGDRGQVTLTAAAVTGTGAPGTSFAGAGQGGGDAVVGATGADSVDDGFYVVQNATISFLKSQTVLDPFGGTKVVPGSIITYTLVATINGSGTLTNVVVSDAVPANTTYQVGTLTLEAAVLSDTAADDAGEYTGTGVTVRAGAVPSGQTRTITFKVRVN
ncbi:MAG: hypothetical protein ABL918_04810 [Chakrabartia sp.]